MPCYDTSSDPVLRIPRPKENILLQLHTIQYVQPPFEPNTLPHTQEEDDLVRLQSTVITGDVSDVLRHIPSGFVQTVITSPPYWSLRDYATPGQIGAEIT